MAVPFPVLSQRLKQELPGGIARFKISLPWQICADQLEVSAREAMVRRADLENFHPLLAPASFPRMLSAGSGGSRVFQWVF